MVRSIFLVILAVTVVTPFFPFLYKAVHNIIISGYSTSISIFYCACLRHRPNLILITEQLRWRYFKIVCHHQWGLCERLSVWPHFNTIWFLESPWYIYYVAFLSHVGSAQHSYIEIIIYTHSRTHTLKHQKHILKMSITMTCPSCKYSGGNSNITTS